MIIRKINKVFYKIGYFLVFFFKPKIPFDDKIIATKKDYLKLWENAKNEKFHEVDAFEKKIKYKIDENWFQELALHTQVVKKKSKLNYVHGRLLYSTLRSYIKNFKEQDYIQNIRIIETGTARGFSSLCMAKALHDSDYPGNIITLDIIPNNLKMYWNCIDDHEGKKTRIELLSKWSLLVDKYLTFIEGDASNELKKISINRINFAFLDGAHTFNDVMNEFKFLKNKQIKGDIIFFDDYNKKQFPGIIEAVDKICSDENYHKEEIYSSDKRGYVIVRKK